MPAYNVEPWIATALESVLTQTSPPDEVVVVDDGSTDGTTGEVERFGDAVRIVSQANRGCAGAFNTGFAEARGDYVALCPADDRWEPRKLEWQRDALSAQPEVDVAFGHATNFGLKETEFAKPSGEGVLNLDGLARSMFVENVIADPSAVVRRSLWQSLGPFSEEVPAEDYEFWWRAIRAGAVFYYDRRVLVTLRQHGGNLSMKALRMWESNYRIHTDAAPRIGDERLVAEVLSRDLRAIGRCRLGLDRAHEARDAYRESLRRRVSPAAVAWTLLLSLPGARLAIRAVNSIRRRAQLSTPAGSAASA
jgi:glycosyltransferase involved in cell wall biosynthesis